MLDVKKGDLISLVPLTKKVFIKKTYGLEYSLCNEALKRNHSRGISNVCVSNEISIKIESGTLIVIHISKNKIT